MVALNLTVPNNTRVTALRQPWQDEVGGAEIGEICALADRLGFTRLTVGEHFAIPAAHVAASGAHYVHATTALAYVAGHTSRIRVAANVSIVPLQHPLVQAKQWATLDWLSGGRADLIVGVGWLAGEFDLLGVDFAARGRIVDEHVQAMRAVWSSELASFHGDHVAFDDVAAEPKPLQPGGVPLWFAGDVPATLRRVAQWGVGWSPFLTPPARIPEGIDRIRSHPAYDGRRIDVFYNLANLGLAEEHRAKAHDGDFDTWDVQRLVDQIGQIAACGVTEVAPPVPRLRSYAHYLERLHWLAEEIMPRVASLHQ
ncbi:MAG: TIGR03619 family F420-dependent LLM class oxidoreductase [Microbacterium sp.]